MKLNSIEAHRLVDLVTRAQDVAAAVAAAQAALSFLIGQLHLLGELANGYPRNPIERDVWQEGRRLTAVCDQFADAVAAWRQHHGEEQATRLAASMALQITGHYPEEIFPRVLRNAKCCESLGMTIKAAEGYGCIVADFDALDLEHLLDPAEPLEGSRLTILSSLREALAGLERTSQHALTDAQLALRERLVIALETS